MTVTSKFGTGAHPDTDKQSSLRFIGPVEIVFMRKRIPARVLLTNVHFLDDLCDLYHVVSHVTFLHHVIFVMWSRRFVCSADALLCQSVMNPWCS